MLKYTGHPFLDVGIAAITAFAKKQHPEDVTLEDLVEVAKYIEQNYVIPPLTSVLTMSLPNSGFTQPAFDVEKKREYAHRVSQSLSEEYHQGTERCIFTGELALHIPLALKDDIAPGRAFRQHIPLLTGEGSINFFPDGDAGLPISGEALLAFQFMPMGCAKCGVGLLAVHSESDRITLLMTKHFLDDNIKAVQLAQTANEKKLPSAPHSPKTLLVDTLIAVEQERHDTSKDQDATFSVTAYNYTNSGQGVDLVIYHLPMNIMSFLRIVQNATYKKAWQLIVKRSWQIAKPSKDDTAPVENNGKTKKNFLYEDLFGLENPSQWRRFIQTYFLRIPKYGKDQTDPRCAYNLQSELDLVSWSLVELFLRKVVSMDESRIAQIRSLGDQLALYVKQQGGKRYFRDFFTVNRPEYLRTLLIKANTDHIKHGEKPLFDMDGYITVFEEGVDIARPDWRLARDLVLMRMIDQLQDWLQQNSDAIPENTEVETTDAVAAERN